MCQHHDLWLAHRKNTGCKQYVFYSFTDLWNYFNKAPYKGETIYYAGHQFVRKGRYTRPFITGELHFEK